MIERKSILMRKITNELILSFKNHLIEEEKSENTCVKYIRDI
ncbi:MAG: phage integrase SAM-like domain-containing protein, partial [Oscillospiraceae bacterium]|nr:phage integrase SAM-like domain-containing protein [Oscillospiraceae bacterium]